MSTFLSDIERDLKSRIKNLDLLHRRVRSNGVIKGELDWSRLFPTVKSDSPKRFGEWMLRLVLKAKSFQLPEDGLIFDGFRDDQNIPNDDFSIDQLRMPFEVTFLEWNHSEKTLQEQREKLGQYISIKNGLLIWSARLEEIFDELIGLNEEYPFLRDLAIRAAGFDHTLSDSMLDDMGCMMIPFSQLHKENSTQTLILSACCYVLNADDLFYKNLTYEYPFEEENPIRGDVKKCSQIVEILLDPKRANEWTALDSIEQAKEYETLDDELKDILNRGGGNGYITEQVDSSRYYNGVYVPLGAQAAHHIGKMPSSVSAISPMEIENCDVFNLNLDLAYKFADSFKELSKKAQKRELRKIYGNMTEESFELFLKTMLDKSTLGEAVLMHRLVLNSHAMFSHGKKALINFVSTYLCQNIEVVQRHNPKTLKKKKANAVGHKSKLYDLVIKGTKTKVMDSFTSISMKTGKKVRTHQRRGHIRCLSSGKNTWVSPTVVNADRGRALERGYKLKV